MLREMTLAQAERTVSLVDADDTTRRSAAFLLRAMGYRVDAYQSVGDLDEDGAPENAGCVLLDLATLGDDARQSLAGLAGRLPVIVVTGLGDVPTAVSAMKAGAVEFIERPFRRHVLEEALDTAFGPDRDRAGEDPGEDVRARLKTLSPRERDVLEGLARGLPNKLIAHELGISHRTVEIHRARMMAKLGVQSLSQALRLAFTDPKMRPPVRPRGRI